MDHDRPSGTNSKPEDPLYIYNINHINTEEQLMALTPPFTSAVTEAARQV